MMSIKGKKWINLFILICVILLGGCKGLKVEAANDSFSRAKVINVNATTFDKKERYQDNYYKFIINSSGYVNIEFTHEEYDYDLLGWEITLYDSDRDSIINVRCSTFKAKTQSGKIGLPAGTYYVQVGGLFNEPKVSNYGLCVNYSKTSSWEQEFNDGFMTANKINVNRRYYGNINQMDDNDLYKFNLKTMGNIDILFYHEEVESDRRLWTVELYDSERALISEMDVYGAKTKSGLKNIKLSAGNYYICVKSCNTVTAPNIDYGLRVVYTTPKTEITKLSSVKSKQLQIKWKKINRVNGYEVVLSPDRNLKKNKKKIKINNAHKTGTTVKKLKRNKIYYVKVRGYRVVGGTTYYGPYSKIKRVKIR